MISHTLILVIVGVCSVAALPKVKRQAGGNRVYDLPDGAELIVGPIQTTFSCEGRQYGYYADEANQCKIFHVCNPVLYPDGNSETLIYSFFCGNQTVFDQSQLICEHTDDAIPCSESSQWLYLNDFFGNLEKEFYPRKAIPDQRPQGSVDSAPNVVRRL